jgi:hypothetical protein
MSIGRYNVTASQQKLCQSAKHVKKRCKGNAFLSD